MTPADEQMLTQVADKLKARPNAHATINGYTDNSGAEGINIPLSTVAGDHLVVRGLGSVDPVATNDTAEGRAKNRRVEIVVS